MQSTINDKITLLTPEQAQEYIQTTEDFYLLDVRTQEEYDTQHLAESTLIPQGELSTRLHEIPKDKDILIYCRSGNRARLAAAIIAPTLPDTSKILVLNGFTIYDEKM